MDISELKPSERIIDIVHPGTEELLGIKVNLLSVNDPALEKLKRKFTDEKLKLQSRGKNFKADDIEENLNMLCFKAMTGWEWGKTPTGEEAKFHGEKPAFNQANVLKVFAELKWFRDQIEEEMSNQKAFFQT